MSFEPCMVLVSMTVCVNVNAPPFMYALLAIVWVSRVSLFGMRLTFCTYPLIRTFTTMKTHALRAPS